MKVFLILLLVSTFLGSPVALPAPLTQTGAFRGTPFTIAVHLKDQNGNPIDNATILFFHETHNEYLGSEVTNLTGHTHFIWEIPTTHELGPIQLNATFRGDPERFLLPSMIPIPVTIFAQLDNSVDIKDSEGNSIDSPLTVGQNLYFHIIVRSDDLSPIEGILVQLILEPDQIIKEDTTLQNGSVILSCLLNQSLESPVTFTVRSMNYDFFNGSERSYIFTIGKEFTNFIGLPAFLYLRGETIITGHLCQISGSGIENASIEVFSDTESLITSTLTESDGGFQFDLQEIVDTIENHRFLILRYNGSGAHTNAQAIIGIIQGVNGNPFSHFLDTVPSTGFSSQLQQFSIIIISFLTIGTTIITIRMKRSTGRIVSH
ncbi:MAG: hypothetical protein ACFFDE_09915 [Promethearchaeota archaeon]